MNNKFPADTLLRVEAALDGELDATNALLFERELAADPALRALYEQHAATRAAVREFAPKEFAPDTLRKSVLGLARERTPRPTRFGYGALAFAASLSAVAFCGWFVATRLAPTEDDPRLVALVAGYMRGQVSGQPFDVASSDRHTVKPWLASRVTLGAAVVDLSDAGFPLAGGRIDIINRTPVPTLVYRRREHIISLSELPISEAPKPRGGAIDGYHIELWTDSERVYFAISDLDAADLAAFAEAFRAARRSEDTTPAKP